MAAQFATEAGDEPMNNALWRYALQVYSRPGVESFLLRLQDEFHADILQILAVLWANETALRISEEALNAPDYVAWRESMIQPLRDRRRACQRGEHGDLYELLKKAELEAERYGLGLLWTVLKDSPAASENCGIQGLMLICNSEKECRELLQLAQP
ncbi:TIGR02444 family protein [Thalassolituus sp.]|uniref:TIGR02444 family protein n=1 Tax=Thalassolituus sp. TaxID=2030822 RepID=UPI0035136AC1